LELGVGLVLLGLTLYISTLAYTLRDYSRAEVSRGLGNGGRQRWLDWLDAHEAELQGATSFGRVACNLGVLVCISLWYLRGVHGAIGLGALIIPAVAALILLLVFSVGIPQGISEYTGEAVLARSLPALAALWVVFWPVAQVVRGIKFIVRRLLGRPEETPAAENERREQEILEAISEGEAFGAVDEEQADIIESVFELDDTDVAAIMTPRTDINAIRADATYEQARDAILRGGHSRIPVYEQSIDHIVGVLYAKDLLRLEPGQKFDTRRLMRTAQYVPETKSISELLKEFRQSKVQIAIVLDEYGGTAGLVSLEDILEELVGEIVDEYDQHLPPAIRHIDQDTLEVDARVHVDEINQELNVELPENGDYETIGGFVFSELGKIPAAGEEFTHGNVRFRVTAAEPRKINRVHIHVVREKAEAS
jgi:putative hemolysin